MKRLRRLFLPPPGSSRLRRALSFVVLIGVPVLILYSLTSAWDYTNSANFCGKTCHTMPPEYSTYIVSPHARVPCVDCHIGRDTLANQFVRKTGHMRLLWDTVTNSYTYPIVISDMRPARETCERCHFPEQFSDDSLHVIHRHANDEQNTAYDIDLLLHVGGGSQREGLGKGIHWHIENKIEYVVLDKEEQQIPWVKVQYVDGRTAVFMSTDKPIDTNKLGQYTVRQMDCITCHNRISHLIDSPDDLVDRALTRGDLSSDIPFIRARAVEVLSAAYASTDDAHKAIAGIEDYYRTNYPDFYAKQGAKITQAIQIVKRLYDDNNYIDQKLDWKTHPDNIGHQDFPGCFRCHDGKHADTSPGATMKVIPLECNLCHSIPQIVRPGVIEPLLPLTTGLEPSSHLDSTWISQHYTAFNETCSNCHSTDNAGGTTDTSFCSNSACHGINWQFAGFNAPGIAQQQGTQQQPPPATPIPVTPGEKVTYQTLQPIFVQNCGRCHGDNPTKGLRLIDYKGIMAGSQDGPVIVPGSPDQSKIIAILSAGHFAKLTDSEMALLREWIQDGAPEGTPVAPAETTATPGPAAPTISAVASPTESGASFWSSTATPAPTTEGGSSFWGSGNVTATTEPGAAPGPTATPSPAATPTTSSSGASFWGSTATPTGTAGESAPANFWGATATPG